MDIDFSEPVPSLVDRLKSEHVQFNLALQTIQKELSEQRTSNATEHLRNLHKPILKHAVEEESILLRVILRHIKREDANESIKIIQEHNNVVDFFVDLDKHGDNVEYNVIQNKTSKFIELLRTHFLEEERVVFPLALECFQRDNK